MRIYTILKVAAVIVMAHSLGGCLIFEHQAWESNKCGDAPPALAAIPGLAGGLIGAGTAVEVAGAIQDETCPDSSKMKAGDKKLLAMIEQGRPKTPKTLAPPKPWVNPDTLPRHR